MNIDLNTKEMQQVVYNAINDAIRGSIHDLFDPENVNENCYMPHLIRQAIINGIDKALCTGPDTMNAIEMGMKRGVEEAMRGTPPLEDIVAFEERLKEIHNAD
jgi:hypothetical protein|tara:strand:- start:234 stop:542 length:309 start_codon:yes stop_codon:yes gene_type:complete